MLIFQYRESNIGLFFIAPYKVIDLNILCLIFGIISFFSFLFYIPSYRSPKYRDSCHPFSLLNAIAMSFPLLFAIKLKKSDNYRYRECCKSDN